MNAASEGAYVVTFGPFEKVGDTAVDEVLDTFQVGRVEAGREAGRSWDLVEGSLTWGSVLVVQRGALGRTGAYHCGVRAEVGPSHLGG